MKISGLMGSNCTMHSAWYEHEVVKCFQQWTFPSSSQADKKQLLHFQFCWACSHGVTHLF